MKIRPLHIAISFSIFVSFLSCKKSNFEENKELNFIISSIIKTENRFNPSIIYINDSLKQLKVYVPSKDEIEQKIPPPPPGKTTSILRLLDFKQHYTAEDSIKALNQNNYALKTIKIDKNINPKLKISNSNNTEKTYLSFSTPIYFTNGFAYNEVGYYDHGFSRGTAYLMKKENGNWKIWDIESLWIT